MKEARTTWIPILPQQSHSTFLVTNVKRWSSFLLKSNIALCQKVFTTPGSLRNHTKIHTGATSCPVCSRQLATVSSLNRHMKSEHKDAPYALWAATEGPLSTPPPSVSHFLAAIPKKDSEWIYDVWLFRLLLDWPLPDRGDSWAATYLSNLPQLLWQQSCSRQPPAVPWGQNQLSILWQHILQHFQLEQAREEASYWCIADRLLTLKRASFDPCL